MELRVIFVWIDELWVCLTLCDIILKSKVFARKPRTQANLTIGIQASFQKVGWSAIISFHVEVYMRFCLQVYPSCPHSTMCAQAHIIARLGLACFLGVFKTAQWAVLNRAASKSAQTSHFTSSFSIL
jgi:hypothetical protein